MIAASLEMIQSENDDCASLTASTITWEENSVKTESMSLQGNKSDRVSELSEKIVTGKNHAETDLDARRQMNGKTHQDEERSAASLSSYNAYDQNLLHLFTRRIAVLARKNRQLSKQVKLEAERRAEVERELGTKTQVVHDKEIELKEFQQLHDREIERTLARKVSWVVHF